MIKPPIYYLFVVGYPRDQPWGPLLFLSYFNDGVDCFEDIRVTLYPDDSVFYLGGSDPLILNQVMSISASRFFTWCQANRFTLKLSKSKVMFFTRLRGPHLERFFSNLGITMDLGPC